jgi:hypothetical protein
VESRRATNASVAARPPQRSQNKISSSAIEAATWMTRNGLIPTCFVCLLVGGVGRAHGLDPSRHITQYAQTAWRVQDGIFGGTPNAITQTLDGYLWIGTLDGLVRFDGVRFRFLDSA